MSVVALRLGVLVAGVAINEYSRYKRSRKQKRRKQQKLLEYRADENRHDRLDEDDLVSEDDSSDDYDENLRQNSQALVPTRSHSFQPEYTQQRPRPHPRAKTSYSNWSSTPRSPIDQGVWLLDTGAGQHSCSNRALFTTYTRHPRGHAFARGIGRDMLPVLGMGTVHLHLLVDGLPRVLELRDVAHIPDQQCEHLMAFDPFMTEGGRLWTEGWTTYVADRMGEVKVQCTRVDGACRVVLDNRLGGRSQAELNMMRDRVRETMQAQHRRSF